MELRVELDKNLALLGERVILLTPSEAELLYALVERYPRTLSFRRCLSALYGNPDNEPPHASDTLKVYISILRRKVGKWRIVNIHSRGYTIVERGDPLASPQPRRNSQ